MAVVVLRPANISAMGATAWRLMSLVASSLRHGVAIVKVVVILKSVVTYLRVLSIVSILINVKSTVVQQALSTVRKATSVFLKMIYAVTLRLLIVNGQRLAVSTVVSIVKINMKFGVKTNMPVWMNVIAVSMERKHANVRVGP